MRLCRTSFLVPCVCVYACSSSLSHTYSAVVAVVVVVGDLGVVVVVVLSAFFHILPLMEDDVRHPSPFIFLCVCSACMSLFRWWRAAANGTKLPVKKAFNRSPGFRFKQFSARVFAVGVFPRAEE